jgi:hypothetical protein
MESFTLKDPTITMLTATNEAMSDDFFTRSAIKGGYFARTFIIYEKSSPIVNSLIYPLEDEINYTSVADYLKEVAKLNGPFKPLASNDKTDEYRYRKVKKGKRGNRDIWFNEVGIVFDNWYEVFCEMKILEENRDDTGTMNRFDASVLKIAMLLSLATEPKLEIGLEAMNEAILQCERLLGNVRRTTMGKQGISQSAILKTLIIMELLNRTPHTVSRMVLMKKMWQNYETPEEFDNMMQGFDAAGMIKTSSVGNQILYTMPETQVQELQIFMAGRAAKK